MIELIKYNTEWPEIFLKEKTLIASLIGRYIKGSIEHIGSTAIVGMDAKPVIDIMVGVQSLSESKAAIALLSKHYCYYPYKPDVMHWFCKPSPDIRTHHLHLVPYNTPLWHERIAFRDHLRTNTKAAFDYAALKRKLAVDHQHDREAYTQNKWPFIKATLQALGHIPI
jgi:GrpB-like predicted nucleotidyltransferase (UPF0157 family)